MRPCQADHPDPAATQAACRLCFLYCTDPAYRALWDGEAGPMLTQPAEPRSLPCVYLGDVIDRLGCACPGKWLRQCSVHRQTTLQGCKGCKDYETF